MTDFYEDWNDLINIAKNELGNVSYEELSDRAREILSEEASQRGKINHARYLQSERWQKLRKEILERDNFLCQHCLKYFDIMGLGLKLPEEQIKKFKKKAEEVHHHSYARLFTENEKDDCVSLCSLHHRLIHSSPYGKDLIKAKIEIQFLKGIINLLLNEDWFYQASNKQHRLYLNSITKKVGDANGKEDNSSTREL